MSQCNNLLVQCMDFRFMKGIRSFLDQRGMTGDCDLVSIAGAAKNISNPSQPSDMETAMKQVGLAHDLHHVKTVVLMNHRDCGAYGGMKAFASPEVEHDQHVIDLRKAGEMVKEKYADVNVMLVLASLGESGEVMFEDIV